MRTTLFLLAGTLSACSPPPTSVGGGADVEAPAQSQDTRVEAPSGVSAEAGATQAIHQSEQTDRIDFEFTLPAEAARLPNLRARTLHEAASAKAELLRQQAGASQNPEFPARIYGTQLDWTVRGSTPQFLSLVEHVSSYTGGAHGNAGTHALIWDRRADREVPLADLFTNQTKALATIRPAYCEALASARREKRGGDLGDDGPFADCPQFGELTVIPAGSVGGKFSRMLVIADPYVAGPWAEGEYEIELVIPQQILPFLNPAVRSSFPG